MDDNLLADADLARALEERLAAPSYRPELHPASHLAAFFGVTRAAVTNWGARTERTGVHRYPGGYDLNEVMRWLLVRNQDHAARRTKAGAAV